MATNGSFAHQDQHRATMEQNTGPNVTTATETTAATTTENTSGKDLSKDEVGWYFVEQYYTTLSKSPEKLHLFYGKNSQYVSGLEAEISPVSVGRTAIQDRIRELNFQDCKVRISNVDSQASHNNIVIQVIGETSDKSGELKKFVQTFVLAQQPSGYFVLNDIFRYISEEDEEEAVQSAPEAVQSAPETVQSVPETEIATPQVEETGFPHEEPPSEELTASPSDTTVTHIKPDEVLVPELSVKDESAANGTADITATENPAATPVDDTPTPVNKEKITESETKEQPKTQEPPFSTTTQPPPASKINAPVQQTGTPKFMSWANRAAAAVGSTPKPAVPVVNVKSTAASHSRATHSSSKTASVSNSPIVPSEKEKENPHSSGWQTAGENARKQNRPQSTSVPPEKEGTMGYVRNVFERVDEEELRTVLSSFGSLLYFDINRSKNCAFVEYETVQGYIAATAANPHQVSGEPIFVEPRRAKKDSYGGNGYTGGRGGANNRGRGGFNNRGRGPGSSRGRTQASNA